MFKDSIRKYRKTSIAIFLFVGLVILWATIGSISRKLDFWDDDASRGAKVIGSAAGIELFGNGVDEVVYLPEQGWAPEDSLWFYTATQGSDLLPYSFFLHLEQADNTELFRSDANILRYRYLPQKSTYSNPDGLPVGMTRDTYQGKEYMGFTCSACHTTQINYRGKGIRIDGGPAMADMESFMVDLEHAMDATLKDQSKLKRFTDAVLKDGDYDSPEQVQVDLGKYRLAIKSYVVINKPKGFVDNDDDSHAERRRIMTHYGYARLDAFGRIFNRVQEHVLGVEDMKRVLFGIMPYEQYTLLAADIDARFPKGQDRDHVFQKVMQIIDQKQYLSTRQVVQLRDKLFKAANAPVSYPFLWDIPQHDYVQWNGIVANAGLGPMGRNAGQVIGVFGTLDWQEKRGFNLESVLGGQRIGETHVDFKSSINIRNLRRVEDQLRELKSPKWPAALFPGDPDWKVDNDKAVRGRRLFDEYCASCHEQINRDSENRRVVATMTRLDKIGTDPVMASNSVSHTGLSGILRHKYVDVGVGKILLRNEAPVAALLTLATRNVLTSPDPDKIFVQRWAERLFDYAITFFDNEVLPSLKTGNYEPDTEAKPFASLAAYKARSLNGIWATAPYLHNGSVPTLYHLLLPKKRPGDPEGPGYEYRPDTFNVGSRDFDPKQVGFKWKGYDGFEFRTDIYGNSNAGHEYAAGRTPQIDGSKLPALDRNEREDLLEYLKTL